jgi:hypothetical protein
MYRRWLENIGFSTMTRPISTIFRDPKHANSESEALPKPVAATDLPLKGQALRAPGPGPFETCAPLVYDPVTKTQSESELVMAPTMQVVCGRIWRRHSAVVPENAYI